MKYFRWVLAFKTIFPKTLPNPLFYCCPVTKLCPALCNPMDCSPPGSCVHSFPEFVQIHAHWVSVLSNYLILCLPLLFPSFPKHQGLFQWVGCLHQVAKVLELQLQHHLFQWTLKNDFLSNRLVWSPSSSRDSQASSQHHNLKASILWCPSLFMVQFSYLYMTTGKTIALTRWTFARKAKSLLFNMLSSL